MSFESKSRQAIESMVVTSDDVWFGLEPELTTLDAAKFVVIEAPYEATVSYGGGTASGPEAIRAASQQVEFYDDELDAEPLLKEGVCSLTPLAGDCDGEEINKRIYSAAKQAVDLGKIPALIGGEHTVSYGNIRACAEKHEGLSVLHFDAHSDLREEYAGQKWNHATAAARFNELCPIVQVGIRSREKGGEGNHPERPVHCYPAFKYRSFGPWCEEAVSKLSDKVYITVDVDGFDPSVMPGTGTPEPGGLDWWTVIDLIHLTAKSKQIVGFDIVEVAPIEGTQQTQFAAAKLLAKLMNYTSVYCGA